MDVNKHNTELARRMKKQNNMTTTTTGKNVTKQNKMKKKRTTEHTSAERGNEWRHIKQNQAKLQNDDNERF